MESDLRAIASEILSRSDADATEVLLTERDEGLTRFAKNEIHQNVAESSIDVRVRVLVDGRNGVARVNQVDSDSLMGALRLAIDTARAQPGQVDAAPLPSHGTVAPPPVDPATAAAGPDERAAVVASVVEAAGKEVDVFGAFSTSHTRLAIANSNGLWLEAPRTIADLRVVAMGEDGKGYADQASSRLGDIDAATAGATAVEKAMRTRGATPIEPGAYAVVLEEPAVAELLEYLSFTGLSGLAVEEGRSFMRLGERVTGDSIHLWDDGHDPAGLPLAFDFEGVVKRRVDLIEGGVAKAVVHDLASARRAGVEPTGHGLPAPNPSGAWATNLFLAGGDATSKEELCERVGRGVFVTRFWYVNTVQPKQSVLTGMTREGTFLIENGKVTRPIKDMRFTQSVMDAFASTIALTRETKLEPGSDYDLVTAQVVPAMALGSFNFTSVTR